MNIEKVLQILKRTYPEAKCSLDYKDTWQLLVAVILSAQCTDKRVNLITPTFFKKYPTIEHIAKAPREAIEESIKSAGYYHSKAKAIQESAEKILEEYKGQVPQIMQELLSLPGVGRKTANVFLAEHGKHALPVDTHVFYLSRKLGWAKDKNPHKVEEELKKLFPKKYWNRINSTLVRFGKTHTSRKQKDKLLEEIKKIK